MPLLLRRQSVGKNPGGYVFRAGRAAVFTGWTVKHPPTGMTALFFLPAGASSRVPGGGTCHGGEGSTGGPGGTDGTEGVLRFGFWPPGGGTPVWRRTLVTGSGRGGPAGGEEANGEFLPEKKPKRVL